MSHFLMPNPSTHILEDSNASSETLPSNYLLCMFPVSSASPVLLVHLFCYKHIQDSPLKKKKKKKGWAEGEERKGLGTVTGFCGSNSFCVSNLLLL